MLDAIYIKSKNTVLETKEDKEYKLCSLLKTARVSKEELDKMSDVNIPEALFEGQRSKLNQILLSQHLLANGHKISQKALIALQMSNKVISKLRKEYSENNKGNGKYLLHKDLLYKIKTITENLKLYKLMLPEDLARQVLMNLHHKLDSHLNTDQIMKIFDSTFCTRNLLNMA